MKLSFTRRAGRTVSSGSGGCCLNYGGLVLAEAKYLGYQIGRGLIKPQEKKVGAIRKAVRPATKTQVRAFLGPVGYYLCVIPNFSSIASPLTDLTKKGQPEKLIWTPEAEIAFESLKRALTSSPILYAPDFGILFILQTDASDTGIGQSCTNQ